MIKESEDNKASIPEASTRTDTSSGFAQLHLPEPATHLPTPTVSTTPLMILDLSVYYNPLFDLVVLKTQVEAAISLYLAELPFDGIVVLSRITDAVQSVEGVEDVVLSAALARTNTGAFSAIARTYQTQAGYIQIDPDQALSSTIQYLPNGTN